ncbi:MAG: nucleotidyltransferase domain-containing protein [Lentisphaeria bacterium]
MPIPFRVDPRAAARHLRERERGRRRRLRGKWCQAQRDFLRIRDVIVNKYAPARIYQWGSLLAPERFSEISDIDIAVEGIRSAEDYFSMLGDVMELTRFPVDLVELDKIDPLHAASIRQHGHLAYSRIPGETAQPPSTP